jgi:hypothetical protein
MYETFLTRELLCEATNQTKGKKRKKTHQPKPEEQGGMPQHRHYPPAKHSEDGNPKYHEEQQKDVA